MGKVKAVVSSDSSRKTRPALSPEAREQQIACYAYDLAEKQILDGTASSQVITHFLKIASARERLEKEILEKQKDLMDAKTEALQAASRVDELYSNALNAFRSYSGQGDPNDY